MNAKSAIISISVFSFLIFLLGFWRSFSTEANFKAQIQKMEQESGQYDRELIAMVDRLEEELAERASFPYLGGKDPMTGKVRSVVPPPSAAERREARREARRVSRPQPALVTQQAPPIQPASLPETPVVTPMPEPKPEPPKPDPVRLTAILYDDFKKAYTAIMMVGERSYSVEVGDKLHGRLTRDITANRVILEDDKRAYHYDISGAISNRAK